MDKLKPCPFCGSKKIELLYEAWCICRGCEAEGPYRDTERDAAEAWNRRVNEYGE